MLQEAIALGIAKHQIDEAMMEEYEAIGYYIGVSQDENLIEAASDFIDGAVTLTEFHEVLEAGDDILEEVTKADEKEARRLMTQTMHGGSKRGQQAVDLVKSKIPGYKIYGSVKKGIRGALDAGLRKGFKSVGKDYDAIQRDKAKKQMKKQAGKMKKAIATNVNTMTKEGEKAEKKGKFGFLDAMRVGAKTGYQAGKYGGAYKKAQKAKAKYKRYKR